MDESDVVRVTKEQGATYVSLDAHWRKRLTPGQLASRLMEEDRRLNPARVRQRMPHGDMRGMSWEDLQDLFALQKDYVDANALRVEQKADARPARVESKRRGATVIWNGNAVAGLSFDGEWIEKVPTQTLAETLTELLNDRPDAHAGHPESFVRATSALERFWQRRSR